MHLLGKRKAGDSCGRIHNPPCRFFQKEACTKGKDCTYPHHQPTAAAAKSDEESAEASTGEKRQTRGRSKDKSRTRSQTPGPRCGVCRAGSWGTGGRIESELQYRSCAAPKRYQPQVKEEEDDDENESFSYLLGTATPSGNVTFGRVQTYDRELTNGESLCKLEPLLRDRSYKHPAKLKKLSSKLAA